MAHEPLFDSAWFKWLGAIVRAQTLKDDITNPVDDADVEPVRAVRAEYYPKRHGFSVVVDELAPMSLRRCLLLGDIANNFRASLDHLAWALVTDGTRLPVAGSSRSGRNVLSPSRSTRTDSNTTPASREFSPAFGAQISQRCGNSRTTTAREAAGDTC
jgi:hypothetical protein